MEAVQKADVDFDNKTVVVTTKPGQSLSEEACAAAFKGTPYSVTKFEKLPPARSPAAEL